MPPVHATATPEWSPILETAERVQAWEAIRGIAEALARDGAPLDPAQLGASGRELSLAGGDAGISLFFGELARAGSPIDIDAAALRDAYLARALSGLASQPLDASLYGGFTGIAWALTQQSGPPAPDDALVSIDEALLGYLSRGVDADLDLISGLVGIGVYLLDRLPLEGARKGLEAIVLILSERAERTGDLITWRVPAEALTGDDRRDYPQGRHDLGAAHGVPGIIAFLGRALAANIARPTCDVLLGGAVNWLLAQVPAGKSPRFPYWVATVGAAPETRVAWCYGDLGVALALFVAGGAAERRDWTAYALELGRRVVERPLESAGIADAGLCHGTAGAAHLFNRLFQATGAPNFAAAARHWFRETLKMRNSSVGFGGYQSLIRNSDLTDVWISSPEFLNGAAGIGLALLAACASVPPAWDRAMLISPLPHERQQQTE